MKRYLIASYTHFLNGKHTNLGGPAQHLAKYLGSKAYCIWQPIPIGKPTWVYALLKIRDIVLVLAKHKPAEVFVGVEAINAILGRMLGYQRVIYWNLDYSPKRGAVWAYFDRLAIRLADEVWSGHKRDTPKWKEVPIGAWLDEISYPDIVKRNPNGVVYIGLLEDMQGVGDLMTYAMFHRELDFTIIGTGKDAESYKSLGLPNVWFTGVLDDEGAQRLLCSNTYGWAMYHKDNPTIKHTMPTKITTYISCGLKVWSNIEYKQPRDWGKIFKEVLV